MSFKTLALAFAGGVVATRLVMNARDRNAFDTGGERSHSDGRSNPLADSPSEFGGASSTSGSLNTDTDLGTSTRLGAAGAGVGLGTGAPMASAPAPVPGLGTDSPNPAETLRDGPLSGSPVTPGSPMAEQSRDGNLFSSSSQRGEEAETAGLPDLTRGA